MENLIFGILLFLGEIASFEVGYKVLCNRRQAHLDAFKASVQAGL